MLVDLCRLDGVMYYLGSRWLQWKKKRKEGVSFMKDHSFFSISDLPSNIKLPGEWLVRGLGLTPAINIEHSIERSGAFVVIVVS